MVAAHSIKSQHISTPSPSRLQRSPQSRHFPISSNHFLSERFQATKSPEIDRLIKSPGLLSLRVHTVYCLDPMCFLSVQTAPPARNPRNHFLISRSDLKQILCVKIVSHPEIPVYRFASHMQIYLFIFERIFMEPPYTKC